MKLTAQEIFDKLINEDQIKLLKDKSDFILEMSVLL